MFYLAYLDMKDDMDYNGIETYISSLNEKDD